MEFSKFDKLIYYVEESGLGADDVLAKVKELFPAFGETDTFNDRFISAMFIEEFAYNISLGLSIVEAGYNNGCSATLLKQLFNGERLSLPKLVDFAKAITFSGVKCKVEHLREIEETDGVLASVTFLEKAFANKYGNTQTINVTTGFAEQDESEKWVVEVHHVENKVRTAFDEKQTKLSAEEQLS